MNRKETGDGGDREETGDGSMSPRGGDIEPSPVSFFSEFLDICYGFCLHFNGADTII